MSNEGNSHVKYRPKLILSAILSKAYNHLHESFVRNVIRRGIDTSYEARLPRDYAKLL